MHTVELPGGTLLVGDCLERLRELPDASVEAVVTDPPYNLSFMAKPWDAHNGSEDAGFAYWLSGLIDGEGHFGIKAHTRGTHAPFFALKMRSDERGLLERICRTLGVGTISEERREPNPMVKYVIQDKSGCQRLVDLLDKYPLRAKKRLDYWTWREAVCDWSARPRGNRWAGQADNTHMAHLRDRLMETRAYTDVPWSGHEFQDWCRLWAAECLRVLKPGGHLLAFGGSRTYHRLACALEDAGFELRDSIAAWLYGSGMPKGLDISKAIDNAAGAERPVLGLAKGAGSQNTASLGPYAPEYASTAPATEDVARWEGWGTALKPSFEPVIVARKPLEGTVAANVLTYGVGGLNIDATRVEAQARPARLALGQDTPGKTTYGSNGPGGGSRAIGTTDTGRWPANTVLAHHPECELVGEHIVKGDARAGQAKGQRPGGFGDVGSNNGDPAPAGTLHGDDAVEVFDCHPDCWVRQLDGQSGVLTSGKMMPTHTAAGADGRPSAYGKDRAGGFVTMETYGDSGGASRFFPTFRYPVIACALCEVLQSCRDTNVSTVDESSPTTPAALGGSAAKDVKARPDASIVQRVRSAANLCGSCGTAIAASLALVEPASMMRTLGLPSMDACSERILSQNLALCAEFLASSDTTSTTIALKTSLGYVVAVISECITRASERSTRESGRLVLPAMKYEAKASSAERRIGHVGDEEAHPTVKPIDLMRWLLRLVVPPGGTVLDPFLGSGTTAVAAVLEGFEWVGCERMDGEVGPHNPEGLDYVPIIEARVRAAKSYEGLPTEALVKARGRRRQPDAKPKGDEGQASLFGDGDAA